ncbi:MAG: DNA-processing protein DprA [Candidatus Dormibacteria bacterium]
MQGKLAGKHAWRVHRLGRMPSWIGISGSLGIRLPEVDRDVTREVVRLVKRGTGIVTGGAPGVDMLAMDASLHVDPTGRHLKVVLPCDFPMFLKYVHALAYHDIITRADASHLSALLHTAKKLGCCIEHPEFARISQEAFSFRNAEVVRLSEKLLAFHVDNSGGTTNTIRHALRAGKDVYRFVYVSGRGVEGIE